jgi:hypothetical protein
MEVAPEHQFTMEHSFWGMSQDGSLYITEDEEEKGDASKVSSLGRPYGAEAFVRLGQKTV